MSESAVRDSPWRVFAADLEKVWSKLKREGGSWPAEEGSDYRMSDGAKRKMREELRRGEQGETD